MPLSRFSISGLWTKENLIKNLIQTFIYKYMTDEEFEVVEQMEQFGGSFVKALAECFHRADPINFNKLKIAFPEYWDEYKKYAEQKK